MRLRNRLWWRWALPATLLAASVGAVGLSSATAQAGGELAGVYAVRRVVTNSTCSGASRGDVATSIWLIVWSSAGYRMHALGPTVFHDFQGRGEGGTLTLTSTSTTQGGLNTMTLQVRRGGPDTLVGTETVSEPIARCSTVREVVARAIHQQ